MTEFIMIRFPMTESSNGVKVFKKENCPDLSNYVYVKTTEDMEVWEHADLQIS